jgi:hypothetical protein
MINYPVTQDLAAQHRDDLIREAEWDRLAREATGAADSSARQLLSDFGRRLLALVRRMPHGHPATPPTSVAAGPM